MAAPVKQHAARPSPSPSGHTAVQREGAYPGGRERGTTAPGATLAGDAPHPRRPYGHPHQRRRMRQTRRAGVRRGGATMTPLSYSCEDSFLAATAGRLPRIQCAMTGKPSGYPSARSCAPTRACESQHRAERRGGKHLYRPRNRASHIQCTQKTPAPQRSGKASRLRSCPEPAEDVPTAGAMKIFMACV